MLKSQRNEVLRLISNNGLDPAHFRWAAGKSSFDWEEEIEVLEHKIEPFWFRFDFKKHQHYVTYAPGRETPFDEVYSGNWEYALNSVKSWLQYVQRELAEPDLWQAVEIETAVMDQAGAVGTPNTPFDADDQARVSAALKELRGFLVEELSPVGDRLDLIDARLNYLQSAATRIGRKDWLNVAVGVLVGLTVDLALTPEASREMFRLAGQLLQWVSGSQPLLP